MNPVIIKTICEGLCVGWGLDFELYWNINIVCFIAYGI